jgi:hypothetical protein
VISQDARAVEVAAKSASPAVVVEIAEPIKAALQLFRSVALFLSSTPPRHIPAPLGVPHRIVRLSWALKATTEAHVGVRLDDCDPRIDLAACTLALDIAPAIIAVILAGPAN